MMYLFKILGDHDRWDAEDFLKLEESLLRERIHGHALKLQKPRHRTHKRNKFFSSSAVEHWNKLLE